jgi:aryl-alcohol dehydrogenase-like predicted oxidoreductase
MEYKTCGNSGLELPVISLGTWLTAGNGYRDEDSIHRLNTALDVGIWFIDTADVYDNGEAERVVGKFLKTQKREEIIIGTKAFGSMSAHPLQKGLSARHLINACDQSLQRLNTDYVDLYQCHRYDIHTPLTEVIHTMQLLIQSGKIRYWGVSQWSAVQITNTVRICEQNGWIKPVSNQPIYNMLNRSLETDVMEVCETEGLGLICYSPLAQGLLTGKYTSADKLPEGSRASDSRSGKSFPLKRLNEENLHKIEQLKGIASDLNISMTQLALAWCLRYPAVTSLITGASAPEQIQHNAAAAGIQLSDDIYTAIEDILDNHPRDQYTGNLCGYSISTSGY